MEFDWKIQLAATVRKALSPLRDGEPAHAVTLARSYEAAPSELWEALTGPERVPRWFLPISGDLRPGGRFQLEGNAGGDITACEPPARLGLTWEFGGDTSWVEIGLEDEGDGWTRLTLTHTSRPSDMWDQFGPGATGVGWELALLGLAFHLERPEAPRPDEVEFAGSPDGREFIIGSSAGWQWAAVAHGADPDAARAAARRTIAFYTGEPAEEPAEPT